MSGSLSARLFTTIALPALLALVAPPAHAAPVAVSVTTFSFAPASGYGVDASESAGTLLGASFGSSAFSVQNFVLEAGEAVTFDVGSVQFTEPNGHGGINANETDALSAVVATLHFSGPFAGPVGLNAIGTAVAGAVNDAAADLSIDWAPVQMPFGAGGLLEISFNDLIFTGPTTLLQTATITLLRAPESATAAAVPEPGSLALIGAAMAGLAFVRRRRQ